MTKKEFDIQKDLLTIFKALKNILKTYGKSFTVKFDFEGRYELWSVKEMVILGKLRKEMFFAGLIVQSSYVGFYFMPIYTNPALKEKIDPDLLKTLKGKSCFHIKALSKERETAIAKALELGYADFKQKDWI